MENKYNNKNITIRENRKEVSPSHLLPQLPVLVWKRITIKDTRRLCENYWSLKIIVLLIKCTIFAISFFLSKFSFTNIYDSQDSKEMGGNPLISLYHSHPLHKHLDISWAITARLEPGTFGFQTQVANH